MLITFPESQTQHGHGSLIQANTQSPHNRYLHSNQPTKGERPPTRPQHERRNCINPRQRPWLHEPPRDIRQDGVSITRLQKRPERSHNSCMNCLCLRLGRWVRAWRTASRWRRSSLSWCKDGGQAADTEQCLKHGRRALDRHAWLEVLRLR